MEKKIATRNNEEGLKQLIDSLTARGIKFIVKDGDKFDKYFIYQIEAVPDMCDCCGKTKETPYTTSAFDHLCTECYKRILSAPDPIAPTSHFTEWEAREEREGAE